MRSAVAVILGIVMVMNPGSSLELIVKIAAAFLVASGLVSLGFGIVNRRNGGLGLMLTNAVIDVVLGILIFMFPAEVAEIVMFIIGLLLMVFGIFQLSALLSASSVIRMGPWSFVLPALCTAGGALVVFHPFGLGKFLTLVAGLALLVYGVSEFFSTWKMRKAIREYDIKYTSAAADRKPSSFTDVKDVEYEKVDTQD